MQQMILSVENLITLLEHKVPLVIQHDQGYLQLSEDHLVTLEDGNITFNPVSVENPIRVDSKVTMSVDTFKRLMKMLKRESFKATIIK